jgi:hypothetical protein
MGTEREVAPPRRCGATRLGALLLVSAVPSALLAQEEPAPPNLPVLTNSRLTFEQTAQGDEIVAYVENLHVFLPARDLELWADHAVLWGDRDLLALIQGGERGKKADPLHAGPEIPAAPGRPALLEPAAGDPASLLQSSLREIYAEGHVHFREGKEKVVFAERLYEHLLERRGIVVDCDLLALANYRKQDPDYRFPVGDPARDPVKVPLRVRAARLRLLGQNEVAADDAQFTTCRYGNPHYHVSARSFVLHVETDEELHESPVAEMGGTTLRYEGFPILPLPAFSARPDEGESLPLQRIRAGHSDRYGAYLQTQWGSEMPAVARKLEDDFALQQPLRLDWQAAVDGYSARGVGLGSAFHWREGDKKTPLDFGEIGGYWLRDHADQDQETPFVIDQPDRGRSWFKNRWTPAEFWRLDAEMSWYSDPGFQPEFFEREFKEEKEPENYAHLTRQEGTSRFSLLYLNRINEWQTQQESLPGAAFDQVGEPLWKLPLPGFLERDGKPNYLVLSDYTSVGNFRDQFADDTLLPAQRVVRADTEIELSTSLPLGPAQIRPFTSGRFTGWDRNATDNDNVGRAAGIYGARGELMLHRDFDAWSPALGIDGLRHAVLLEADYENVYAVSKDPSELVPIDDTESFDLKEVYLLAVRQRLQTHRETSVDGKKAVEIVSVIDFDVELPLYPHADRDNPVTTPSGAIEGRSAGPLHAELHARPDFEPQWLKNTTLFAECDWDLYDHRFDTTDVGVALVPHSDWVTLVSWRTTRDLSRTLTGEIDYHVTDKWAIAALEQYDFQNRRGLEYRYELRRIGDDFTFGVGFGHDNGSGDTSLTFSISPSIFGSRGRRNSIGGRGDSPGLDPNF